MSGISSVETRRAQYDGCARLVLRFSVRLSVCERGDAAESFVVY